MDSKDQASDPARTTDFQRHLFWLVGLTVVAGATVFIALPFLTGRQSFYHDSLAHVTLFGLFYDRLFSGDSLLWSAALNGGHPLWVSVEGGGSSDPVVLMVYAVAAALGSGWFIPYHVSVFVWLLVFALGGGLCAHFLTGNRWAGLLAFAVLCAGPVALALPAQSNGFLGPFRYFPLALYFYFRLRRQMTLRDLLYFNTVLAFTVTTAGSFFSLLVFLALISAELILGPRSYLAWLRQICAPRHLAFFCIPLLTITVLIAWFDLARTLVAIPREFMSEAVYFFELDEFLRDLFLPYLKAPTQEIVKSVWHGSSFVGLLAVPFLLFGLRRGLVDGVRAFRGDSCAKPLETHLFLVVILCFALTLSLACGILGFRELVEREGTLLAARNFGLLLTGAYFFLALIVARGFADMMAGRYAVRDIAIDTVLFAGLVLITYRWRGYSDVTAFDLAILVGVFASISALWWRMSTRFGGTLFAIPAVVGVLTELLVFTSLQVLSLQDMKGPQDREAYRTLIESRTPRFGSEREALPPTRAFMYAPDRYWPFHLEGPAVFDDPSAVSEALYYTPVGNLGLAFTHLFRLPAYHDLVTNTADTETLKAILGVSRPILELVPRGALAETADGLRLVLREEPEGGDEPARIPDDEATRPGGPVDAAGRVLQTDYDGHRVSVTLLATEEAVLVYRDNFAPGWSVALDGRPAELLVVDRVNKAVAVPPGEHLVVFKYRPWAFLVTFALRAVVLVSAALACLIVLLRTRRRTLA